jgi:undecaprenyl-diphosphatase
VAAEFSFFLSIPIMFGASLLKLVKFGFHYSMAEIVYLLLGMIVAFLVSIFSISFLLSWIKKNDFKFFGYYRIVLGLIVLVWYFVSSLMK